MTLRMFSEVKREKWNIEKLFEGSYEGCFNNFQWYLMDLQRNLEIFFKNKLSDDIIPWNCRVENWIEHGNCEKS